MKQWRHEEAQRQGISEAGIVSRLYIHGKYPNLKTIRINKRVVFVVQ